MAIEVDDVIRLALAPRAVELLAQCRQRRRAEHVNADESGQLLHGLDQRQRADAVIEVAARLVLRPRGDEQDADRRGDDGQVEHLRVRQPAADTRRLRALEKEAGAVVEQFPRQAEQERGAFARGLRVGFGGAGFESRVEVDGEAAARMTVDLRPRLHHVRRVGDGHRGVVQKAAPLHEVLLHLPRALPEIVTRPDGIFFEIPAQFPGFDGADGRDEPPRLRTGDLTLAGRGGLIDEPGPRRGAADAILLVEFEIGEFEDEFLQRLGFGLGRRFRIGRQPLAHRDKDRIQRRLDPARSTSDRDIERLAVEELLQHAELRFIERKRDDGVFLAPALFLHFQREPKLFSDPLRLQRIGTDDHGKGRRFVDRFPDVGIEQPARKQLPRIDPRLHAVIAERLLERAHEVVVL